MGWDSEHFKPQTNIFVNERKSDEKIGQETKFIHCAECNETISVVSRTLYEIDGKHYCSACYSQKIINLAVERDHFDLKEENAPQTNKAENEPLKPQWHRI